MNFDSNVFHHVQYTQNSGGQLISVIMEFSLILCIKEHYEVIHEKLMSK